MLEIERNCVFSRKVAPGVDGGNLVCATGAASTSFGARVVPIVSAARRCFLTDSMRCAIVFGDPGWQFALEWLQRRVVKVMFGR